LVQLAPQTPFSHVLPLPHAVGVVPHWPVPLHVRNPVVPEHSTEPGMHATHDELKQTGSDGGQSLFKVQPHVPLLEHAGWSMGQVMQVAPGVPVPQAPGDWLRGSKHVPVAPPEQQPPAHVLASQVHVPSVVSHTPLAHELHVAPAVPQLVGVSEAHFTQAPVVESQHPIGHEVASQTHLPEVLSHSCPIGHAAQAMPA
jgi:hypothetical protein